MYVEILRGKIYLTKTPRDMIEVNPLFLKKNLDEIDIDVPSISVTFWFQTFYKYQINLWKAVVQS